MPSIATSVLYTTFLVHRMFRPDRRSGWGGHGRDAAASPMHSGYPGEAYSPAPSNMCLGDGHADFGDCLTPVLLGFLWSCCSGSP
ncbi:uncharacterized protein K489DRAFT_379227 [Dissoconium aciculare CBS 342.82]|uniref:Uncharacterized protein n=1 Tax=Dissoconium aciculare CBS 342.82 TaxID=1314786 RepID=A0A6J3M6V4_9PEZI|nr:uncharacterized protein K489DRAFT_379227 [Dissoconium aciculare CBS 342.82]KAF1823249.1 hypothetical protein K489DRAFT_379227 [Dissoconium aciculare CBS 342.82]